MLRWIVIGCVFFVLGFSGSVSATAEPFCDALYRELLEGDKRTIPAAEKVTAYSAVSEQCAGTGIYEFRLGALQNMAAQPDAAEKSFRRGLALQSPYEKELLMGLGDVYMTRQDLAEAEKTFLRLVEDYPDWFYGALKMCELKVDQKDFSAAVTYCEQSNRLQPNAFNYRNLTIAYHQLGRHAETVAAANKAYELDSGFISDVPAIMSAVFSFAQVGKLKVAKNLLAMHLQKNPDIKNHPSYQKALQFIAYKEKELQGE